MTDNSRPKIVMPDVKLKRWELFKAFIMGIATIVINLPKEKAE